MQTRRILRLHHEGKSLRFIAQYLGISRNTVTKYLHSSHVCGIPYEELVKLSDNQLDEILNPPRKKIPDKLEVLQKLFPVLDQRLKRPGMTKQKLWEEYRQDYPSGYSSTQFYHYYNVWKKVSSLSLHLTHQAGDKMFVDYTGKKLRLTNKRTGEKTPVEVFVAVLGASQYTYVEARMSQKKEDFITCVENALHFFGGVPEAIVPDNLRSAVTKANRYEPVINETFKDFADHYQTIVYPTRIRKPKDKSLVENAVKIIYPRIFAPLDKKTFYDLESLNQAILQKLAIHNETVHTGRKTSRKELFEQMEKPVLKPLSLNRYQMKYIALGTVYKNCHVYLAKDKHYYSVPFYYVRMKVKILFSQEQVDIFHKYNLIASHKRDRTPYQYTTVIDHLPEKYRSYLDLSPEKLINDADAIGPKTRLLVTKILETGSYPDQSFRSCAGIINLSKKVGIIRVENACNRAYEADQYSYTIVKTILEKGLDRDTEPSSSIHLPDHENIRGKRNYK